jgi:hypothetical protein
LWPRGGEKSLYLLKKQAIKARSNMRLAIVSGFLIPAKTQLTRGSVFSLETSTKKLMTCLIKKYTRLVATSRVYDFKVFLTEI